MLEQSTLVANCLEDSTSCELFAFLIEVLKKELVIYGELKEFLREEKQLILKAAPLQKIDEYNSLKENLILKARILEEGRMNVLKKIARNLDIDDRSIKLMSLTNYAVSEHRHILEDLKTDIKEIAGEIRKMNDDNKVLLNTSIDNIKGSLEFISSLVNHSGTYLDNGKIGEVRKNGSILRTEG